MGENEQSGQRGEVDPWKAAHDALKEYVRLLMDPRPAQSALDERFRAYKAAHVAAVDASETP